MIRRSALLLAVGALAGCGKGSAPEPAPAPAPEPASPTEVATPRPAVDAARATGDAPRPDVPCATHANELVYMIDTNGLLWSFDPAKLPADPFTKIGEPKCETKTGPFAMTIDRGGTAWIAYYSGALYPVSIFTARCGQGGPPVGAPHNFSLAYADEVAYSASFDGTDGAFGRLDLAHAPTAWSAIGKIAVPHRSPPDLTGTGDGRLFAFFPDTDHAFVQELDAGTGAGKGPRFDLPFHRVDTFAIAHWGAFLYLFAVVDRTPRLYALRPATGKVELVRDLLPFTVIGAGVSSCAPLLERE